MGKKRVTSRPKKVTKSRKCQIRERKQKVPQTLKQISLDDNARVSNDAEPSLLHAKGKARKSRPKKGSDQAKTNKSANHNTSVDKHSLITPPNLSRPSYEKVRDLTEQYEFDISFVQAIAYLKSATACVSQLSTERLQQIFNTQWNTHDNHTENKGSEEEQSAKKLKRLNVEEQSAPEMINAQSTLTSKVSLSDISKSNAIPVMDKELSFDSDFDMSDNETFDILAELQIHGYKLDETTEGLSQSTSKNCTETAVEEARNMVDTGNVSGNNFGFLPLSGEVAVTQTSDKNEKYKPISSTAKQSDEANSLFQLNPFFGEGFITPIVITKAQNASLPAFDCGLENLSITPPDNLSIINIDSTLDEPQDLDNSQTENQRSSTGVFDNKRSTFEMKFEDLNKPNTPVNNVIVQSSMCDSAYNTEVHYYRESSKTAKSAADKRVPYTDSTGSHYNLRFRENKETPTTSIDPSSVMRKKKPSCIICPEQPSEKKRKRERSCKSVPVEYIILESLRVILTTVSDEKTAERYVTRRHWKDDLLKEAVNAVLSMCDAFRLEGKPDICRKPIVTTVTKTLDEIVTCMRSNKAYVSQEYRVQILLELCNSVSMSVAIIDHLIARLKSFRSMLSQEMEIRHGNQLYLVFYALNIVLRKYRTIVLNDAAETAIHHLADLWKMYCIDEELQNAKLNANNAKERWHTVLKDFTVVSAKPFAEFAKKSLSLVHVLSS